MPNDDERVVPRGDGRFANADDPRKDSRKSDVVTSAASQAPREKTIAERADAGEKVSVNDLAVHLGHVKIEKREEKLEASDGNTKTITTWQHAAAAALHGWAQYEFDEGEPFELTREDYEAALKVAGAPNAAGVYEPHEPAYVGSHDVEGDADKAAAHDKAEAAHKAGAEAAQRARDERRGKRDEARKVRR
jgi:hypothetical protein